VNALSQIASKFRTRAGESLATVRKYETPLAEATTPSLEALKSYSAARKVAFSTGPAAAVPLLQRAVEIDPNFAMAHAFLGRMYGDIWESALSAQSTSRAYELRDRASDRERFSYLAAHQGAEAAAEFQKILDHGGIVFSDPVGAVARLQLGRALALWGDTAKAKTAYQDFLTLWKDADPDIPILKEAKAEYAKLQ
jgi:tetratricopeptide (TPR) repeat protein